MSTFKVPMNHPTVERLLAIMDQKHHWAYPSLTRPGLTRAQLLVHFRHEYAVYVRDFPILLARCLGQVPPDVFEARAALAENIYEEQTGGLSKSAPHPELFLRMMEGLGYRRDQFSNENDESLHPAASAYKEWLFATASRAPWQAACAMLTIFVEGSINERGELAGTYKRPKGDDAVNRHALVVHYGCPPEAMQLVRAHGDVEGGHRGDAWKILLENVTSAALEKQVVDTCMDALVRWHRYRDGVAEWMGLVRDEATAPPPAVLRAG